MSNIEKIVMFQGGVETLDYFSRQLGQAFEAHGLLVFYFDLENVNTSVKKVKKFMTSKSTAIITFNFEGLDRETGIYDNVRGYLWQMFDVPIYNIAVDHPYYYDTHFVHLLEDDKKRSGLLERYFHLSIDKNHQNYVKEFYPWINEAGFIPLAGNLMCQDNVFNTDFENISVSKRNRDLIFTGNYTKLSFFDKYIHAINEEYAQFYMGMIEDLKKNPVKTVEEVIISHCNREMGPQKTQDLRLPIHKTIFVDMYIRNYFRGELVRILADEGFDITVVGAGWEDLCVKRPNRMKIIQQTNSEECIRLIRDSKISLNVMPWFKNGAHDRVFTSVLNGTLCVTDESEYQKQVLSEGEGVCYYMLDRINTVTELLRGLLKDDELISLISQNGIEKVRKEHTWMNRAQMILDIF